MVAAEAYKTMTQFIDKTKDFKGFLSARVLDKLNNQYDSELMNAEKLSVGMVRDACAARYNLDAELGKTGDSRNATLIRWLAILATYFMYNDIADDDIPERVIKNYNDVVSQLSRINAGKESVEFARLIDEEGGTSTKFAWGSEPRRTHNLY